LLAWSTVPALLVLCVAAKLLSLGLLAGHASSSFEAKDAAAVGRAAGALQFGNLVERHKAPFAAGDALALAGDFGTARIRFEEALGLAQAESPDACIIRLNLVLSIERLGDGRLDQEDPASAAALYREALETAGAAPDGCNADGPAAEAGKKLAEAEGRLDGKLETAGGNGAGDNGTLEEPTPAEPEADAPRRDQLEQLAESARESQRERNSGRERSDYLEDTGTGPAVERPW
jgi:hypothetical protein